MAGYFFNLSLDEPKVKGFLFYSSLLVGKTLFMSTLTGIQRHRKMIYISEEDLAMKGGKVATDDPDIERVRRAHLNDLENIPFFIFGGFAYLLTNPDPTIALNLFRSYVAMRFIHTFVYAIYVVPQPARGIAFGLSYAINWYMIGAVLAKFFYP